MRLNFHFRTRALTGDMHRLHWDFASFILSGSATGSIDLAIWRSANLLESSMEIVDDDDLYLNCISSWYRIQVAQTAAIFEWRRCLGKKVKVTLACS